MKLHTIYQRPGPSGFRQKDFTVFPYMSLCKTGGHLVQLSGTIQAILVQGHKRNMSVKLFLNRVTSPEDVL